MVSQQVIDLYALSGSGSVVSGEAAKNTVPPTLSTLQQVGAAISIVGGTWIGNAPISLSYQWMAAGANISGATGLTYTPVTGDIGKIISVRIVGVNAQGSDTVTVAALTAVTAVPLTAPTLTTAPTITGTAQVGVVLTGNAGVWAGNPTPTVTRVWRANGVDIAGATGATYTPVAGDIGKTIILRETATNSQGSDSANSVATAAVIAALAAPANTVLPAITGTAQVGQTLTAAPGTWTGNPTPTYTYQWKRAGANISGATSSTYLIVSGDVMQVISVEVTGTNSVGNAKATSAGTANVTPALAAPVNTVAPAITGTATVGQTLTATNGTWTGNPTPTYTREWLADGVVIPSATGTTYVLVAGDVGKVITVRVTATNSVSAVSATSAGTAAVIEAA